ncbi:hypothetical protein SMB94_003994 [Cronobacter sakazakii]|nr:hypothetical protein [Cronobacter sakazakii]ELY2540663.1 hypothetical protein [Cronobacter sakazakii]ELY2552952.1 hypothetical protein [Cronobacter sakazakii]ELY4823368.1 hypothetical protein [Cronobacter sakazakii]ELY4839699.1 hypothetical protein [Cronobacter sakazakii]
MNNDELIAAGHELAKCLDSNTPLLDIAKMIVRLADKLDVTTAALREKTKQCEQLAAENAALKAFGDKLDRMHNDLNGEGTGIQGRAEVACQQIALEAALEEFDAIKTPATDAFLREVRAQAITSALDSLDGVFDTDCVMETNGISYEEAEQRTTGALAVNSALIEFAAQLRQGGAA